MAPGRGQAARHERRRVRDRAEDRRALDQPHLRGRGLCSRRHAGRWPARGGCNAERAHDQGDLDAHAAGQGRDAAGAARSAWRGLSPFERLQRAERASRRRRQEADAEPAQRGGGLAAAQGLHDHRRASFVDLGPRPWSARGPSRERSLGVARVAAYTRIPHEPLRGAARDRRVCRRGLPCLGEAAHRAGLRDRRDRDQGRLLRPAAPSRRAARPATLGARLQVGPDDRADEAEQDPHPCRPYGCAEPVGATRTGRGRRRHGVAGNAAQRGGHQPQGHPRGRQRDRPARGRRHPSGRRAGAAAREGDEAVQDAEEVPALRRRHRQAGGRGDAPVSEPRLSLPAGSSR